MALRLNGSSSGYVELDVPAAAGSHTLTLPDGGGSSGQYLQTNGSGGLSWQTLPSSLSLTEATTTSTSGSVVNFGSISSDAKEILITFKDVSPASTATLRFRLGTSSGLATSGYQCISTYDGSSTGVGDASGYNEFWAGNDTGRGWDGFVRLVNVTGNTWYIEGQMADLGYLYLMKLNSSITLSGALTQVEFYFSTGNFDSGSWVIRYLT
jgi:hypothetical protein